jgi:hypothetical protein
MIRLAAIKNLALKVSCLTLQVDFSLISNGMQKVECAVLPLGSNSEAIPLEATLITILP